MQSLKTYVFSPKIRPTRLGFKTKWNSDLEIFPFIPMFEQFFDKKEQQSFSINFFLGNAYGTKYY